MKTFGETIRWYRKHHGWTQARLAERVGVSPQYISDIELGTIMPRSRPLIKRMADELGSGSDWMHFLAGLFPAEVMEYGAYDVDVSTAMRILRESIPPAAEKEG